MLDTCYENGTKTYGGKSIECVTETTSILPRDDYTIVDTETGIVVEYLSPITGTLRRLISWEFETFSPEGISGFPFLGFISILGITTVILIGQRRKIDKKLHTNCNFSDQSHISFESLLFAQSHSPKLHDPRVTPGDLIGRHFYGFFRQQGNVPDGIYRLPN